VLKPSQSAIGSLLGRNRLWPDGRNQSEAPLHPQNLAIPSARSKRTARPASGSGESPDSSIVSNATFAAVRKQESFAEMSKG